MSSQPAVSVILPVYNDAENVEAALESILAQNFEPMEVIVVDDGSTDGTRSILSAYEDLDNISVIKHQENQGLSAALNTCIERARGEYVVRQDSDDVSRPDRIRTQYEYIEARPDVAVVSTGAEVIDAEAQVTYTLMGEPRPGRVLDERNPIVHGTAMARLAAIHEVGGYDEFFEFCQDYDLWVRLHRKGYEIHTIQQPLYGLRRDDDLLSIDQRHRIALFGLLARAAPERKAILKERAEEDIDAVYDGVDVAEQGRYHHRMALANLENSYRLASLRHAIRGVVKLPLKIKSYAYLSLTLAPAKVFYRVVAQIEGR